jgi:hypothetical protein
MELLTRFELVIKFKTAKGIGLVVSSSLTRAVRRGGRIAT